MRLPRIYTPQPLAVGTRTLLDARAARHVSRVLRLRTGASLKLFNGDGKEYGARILSAGKSGVEVETLEASGPDPVPEPLFTMIQGVAKGDRMDYALQKAVELGAHRLIPALTEHSVVKLEKDRLARRMKHWQGILISASEQCGRCYLPKLETIEVLRSILTGLPQGSLKLVLDHRADLALPSLSRPEGEVVILTGPEGGLSTEELDLVRDRGFTTVRLGPRVMRTETAPLAALAALQTLWGDFR